MPTSLEDRLKTAGFATDTLKPLVKTDQGQIWSIESPGGQTAIDLWHKLRSQIHVTMHTPIIIGPPEEVEEELEERFDDATDTVETILRTAAMTDGSEVLERRAAEFAAETEGEAKDSNWPSDVQPSDVDFTSVRDLMSGQALDKVQIALLPTIASWMAPAYLKFGGFNDCPLPEDQVSVIKYWTRLYATDVFAITHDTAEMHVTNPPTTREAALQLAREQYSFCPDVVEQGTETIERLAALLLNGRSWFFWWD